MKQRSLLVLLLFLSPLALCRPSDNCSTTLGCGKASGGSSTAMGYQTIASGYYSTAIGCQSVAGGEYSTAIGSQTNSSGDYSIAMGVGTIASGHSSTAMVQSTVASGDYSTATGSDTTASGEASTSMGIITVASGEASTSMGIITVASGEASTSMGGGTLASGNFSTSMGVETTAQSYASLAIGQFNMASGSTNEWVHGEPLLVAGNGDWQALNNAFVLFKNGSITHTGRLTQTGDARLKKNIRPLDGVLSKLENIRSISFEWSDGEKLGEDRHIGVLAQDVEKEFPELVSSDPNGFLSVDYSRFSSVLLQALKEQRQQMEEKQQQTEQVLKEQGQQMEEQRQQIQMLQKAFDSILVKN